VPKGAHLLVTLVPREQLDSFRALVAEPWRHAASRHGRGRAQAAKLPHVFEFAYNHTTLQVLKSDRSATYQQIGVPDPADADAVEAVQAELGDEVWPHHEFTRGGGQIYAAPTCRSSGTRAPNGWPRSTGSTRRMASPSTTPM
jgi:hypothetical protein